MISVSDEAMRAALAKKGLGVSELARMANLSRTTVTRILNGSGSRVHATTREKLANALGLSPESLQKNHTVNEYRRCVADRHGYLERRGLGIVSSERRVPIEHGFVPFALRQLERSEECHRRHAGSLFAVNGEDDLDYDSPKEPLPFQLNAVMQRSKRSFVLGEPGSGKSTMLSRLAWQAASLSSTDMFGEQLPVFVRLSVWAQMLSNDDEVSGIHAAVTDLSVSSVPDTVNCLTQHAIHGDVIFLLDGLDEVADSEDQARILSSIRELISRYPNAQIMITSRPVGFDYPNLGAQFDTYRIERFDHELIEQFISRWCSLRHGHSLDRKCATCREKSGGMRRAVFDNPKIVALSGNPMMLTILCLLYESGAALPQRRVQLYERIIEAFLFTWEQEKRAAVSGAPDRKLAIDDRDALWLLESIALDMQKHDWTLVSRWWLMSKSTTFLQEELGYEHDSAQATSEVLIRSLEQRTGVLSERGLDRYGFQHLAFQEYFAARAILSESDPIEAIRPYIYHPRWREVVRLVASSLDRRRAPQLLRVVLDDPDPTGRFLRRGLLLALECLVDGAPVHHGAIVSHIMEQVVELADHVWSDLAAEAITSLCGLNGTRLEELSREKEQQLLGRAKKCLDRREYGKLRFHAAIARIIQSPIDKEIEKSEGETFSDRPIQEITGFPDAEPITLALMCSSYNEDWAKRVLAQLNSDSSAGVRSRAAELLGRFARSQTSAREGLLRALANEKNVSVRESVADSLRFAARERSVCTVLQQHLSDREEDVKVRAACALALRGAATENHQAKVALIHLLDNAEDIQVRAGAVRGLSRCFEDDQALEQRVFEILQDANLNRELRVACLYALEQRLPLIDRGIDVLVDFLGLGSSNLLGRGSAQTLAEYAATGRVPWESLPMERIEQVLVSIERPCEHALDALRSLVDARELRRFARSREERIERALKEHSDDINCMFVFGSSARDEQDAESDIDLMVIGEVSLRDLTPSLRRAEEEVGRQVNAVVYTPSEWKQRISERNPFVTRVLKAEKRFVMGCKDDLGTVVEQ